MEGMNAGSRSEIRGHITLALVVPAPALHRAARQNQAGVVEACGDIHSSGHVHGGVVDAAMVVCPPAAHGAVDEQCASVEVTAAHASHRADRFRGCQVVIHTAFMTPTDEVASDVPGTHMEATSRHAHNVGGRRWRCPVGLYTDAIDLASKIQRCPGTCLQKASHDSGTNAKAGWHLKLPHVVVNAPTADLSLRGRCTGMVEAHRDVLCRGKVVGRRQFAVSAKAPTLHVGCAKCCSGRGFCGKSRGRACGRRGCGGCCCAAGGSRR